MNLHDLEGKHILILGYAMEGHATEQFLRRFVPSAKVEIADQKLRDDYLDQQKNADVVIKSPGVPRRLVTKPYTTPTNLFFSMVKNPVIGVTGSKGKSTTAALIAAMLTESGKTAHLIGNIGRAAITVLMESVGTDDIFVFELSSYQLEDCEYSPHVAVFTTFFPEHLPHHGGLEEYFEAKANIIRFSRTEDYFVYNPEDTRITALTQRTQARSIPFVDPLPFSIDGAQLKGEHNRQNIRAAFTASSLYGVDAAMAKRAVDAFIPLPHRMTNIGTYRGITFYDDAISTAPESTVFAIETIGNVNTIFLGGEDRGLDFHILAEAIKHSKIQNVVLFPTSGERIAQALNAAGCGQLNFLHTSSMEEAVRFAYERTVPGTTCLLSTASPSYSLWKNFEAKGDDFTKWVKELGN